MKERMWCVRLRVFESGVMVLQLQSHSEEAIIADTEEAVCTITTFLTDIFSLLTIFFQWWLCLEKNTSIDASLTLSFQYM